MNEERIGMSELMSAANVRAYVAECLATMLFVMMGTGTVIVVGGFSPGDLSSLVAIALAHGLAIGMMVYAVANISGGHLNPAVTLSMIVTQNIKIAPGVAYIAAQMLGATVAVALLYLILFDAVGESVNFGAHGVNNTMLGEGGAFLLELVLTFVLVAVIFATAASKKGAARSARRPSCLQAGAGRRLAGSSRSSSMATRACASSTPMSRSRSR